MFIDEDQPWIAGGNQPQGPENVSELRTAIFDSLGKMFGTPQQASKAIKFDERPRIAVLRVDSMVLQKCGVRVGISGEMPKWLRMHRRKKPPVCIPLSNFKADAVFGSHWIEFKFKAVPSTTKPGPGNTAYSPTVQAVERVLKLTQPPVRRLFITRGLNALAELSEKSPQQAIEAANTAASDWGVLVRALVNPDTVTNLASTDDPLAAAKLRGLEAKDKLLSAEGGVITVQEVSKLLDISRQAVDKRRRANQLIGLTRGRRGYAYPAWQFRERQTLPGLGAVLAALNRHDAWTQALFMLHPHIDFDGNTPLEELRAGRIDAVVRAAAQYGEHGAA